MSPALVLGLSPTGLLIVRSLGRRGVAVSGADEDPFAIARASRFCTWNDDIGRALHGDDEGLVRALERFAERAHTPPALFLTSDALIERLLPFGDRLAASFRLTTPLGDVTASMLDKRRFHALCERIAEPTARTVFGATVDDIDEVARGLRYPAIIKPAFSHHLAGFLRGRKVFEAPDAAALTEAFRAMARVDDDLVVQEVIPGPDDAIWIAAAYVGPDGRLEALFTGRKLRQFRPRFGSASLAVSERDVEVATRCATFLRASKFRGLCGLEFKRDARDGTLRMIEVNARATLWMGLTSAAGVDVPHAAYASATGAPPPELAPVEGVKWAYLPRDLQSAAESWRAGELSAGAWARSLRGLASEAIGALDDPLPALFVPAYAARRLAHWRRVHSG